MSVPTPKSFDIQAVYPLDLVLDGIHDTIPRIIDGVVVDVYLVGEDPADLPYITYSLRGPQVLKNGKPGKGRTLVSVYRDDREYDRVNQAVLPILEHVVSRLGLTLDQVEVGR